LLTDEILPDSFEAIDAMNPCPPEQKISAYHDGELTADEQAELTRHLQWCQVCMLRLGQLRQMSAFVSSAAPDGLSQIAIRRLHNKLDEVLERGLVRWAWEVSGVAAAILLVGSIWLAQLSGSQQSQLFRTEKTTVVAPPWVDAQASADPVIQEAPTPAAAWYLADARNPSDVNP
jgi:anti-sigma factor RsiW